MNTVKIPKAQRKTNKPTLSKDAKTPRKAKIKSIYYYAFIGLCAFILYGNTLRNDFAVDDKTLIMSNTLVHQAKYAQLISHGTYYGYVNDNSGAYRPLAMAYYATMYQLGGGKPYLFHFFNVLLYAVCAMGLFMLLKRLFAELRDEVLLVGILLFMVHPIHTEVVANIKNADELLCLAFSLLSASAWVNNLKRHNIKMLWLALGAYALALLSKETAVAFLPVYLCLIFVCAPSNLKGALLKSMGLAATLAGFLLLRYVVLSETFSHSFLPINNSLYAIQSQPNLWATKIFLLGLYAFKMLWALPLSWDYSYGAIAQHTFADIRVWITILLLILSMVIVLRYYRQKAILVLGIVWFWALLMPASNTFILIESTFAERFLFHSSVGFILILLWLFTQLPALGKKIMGAILLISMVIFATQTISRNAQWRNDITLVQADIQHSDAVRIHMSFISDMFRKAEQTTDAAAKRQVLDSALLYAQKAKKILPDYAEVNYLLARSYLYLQQKLEAEQYYLLTIQQNPTHNKALNDLGVISNGRQDYEQALKYFVRALAADTTDYKSAENACIVAFNLKRFPLADFYRQKALQINPASPVAQQMLPKIQAEQKKLDSIK